MNKHGFTLIELLAVIVILAIIALIATPIVIDIIEDARINSYKRSIDMYGNAVEQAVARYQVTNAKAISAGFYSSNNDGQTISKNNEELRVNYSGSKVKCDIVVNSNGTVYMYNCYVNGSPVDYTYGSLDSIVTLISGTKGEKGSKYLVKVNETDVFNFYLLSTSDGYINLIMDRNICEDGTTNYYVSPNTNCTYNWTKKTIAFYGPDELYNVLYNATKDWNNVDDIILNYDYTSETNYTYKSIITDPDTKITTITGNVDNKITNIGTFDKPLKAKLPTMGQLFSAGCSYTSSSNTSSVEGSCPAWLVDNLNYYNVSNDKYAINKNNNSDYKQWTYWFQQIPKGTINPLANAVIYRGCIRGGYSTNSKLGIRPVINFSSNKF